MLLAELSYVAWTGAGRLSWTSQFAFKRLGRAMLIPLYAQKNTRTGRIQEPLRLALRWWCEVLREQVCQMRPWSIARSETVHMLCDARSTPPRVAAVLVIGKQILYSDAEPPQEIMGAFASRGDNQITSLEILAIAFGECYVCVPGL